MLGRTANGLYWMFRYIERGENIARLIDAGLRMALTRSGSSDEDWWRIGYRVASATGCCRAARRIDRDPEPAPRRPHAFVEVGAERHPVAGAGDVVPVTAGHGHRFGRGEAGDELVAAGAGDLGQRTERRQSEQAPLLALGIDQAAGRRVRTNEADETRTGVVRALREIARQIPIVGERHVDDRATLDVGEDRVQRIRRVGADECVARVQECREREPQRLISAVGDEH